MAYTFSDGIDRDYAFYSTPSRRERIARIDALATLLDTAFILPGTNVRFGLDGEELRLVLACFGKLAALVLDFVEEPDILNCDHRLVSEGRN